MPCPRLFLLPMFFAVFLVQCQGQPNLYEFKGFHVFGRDTLPYALLANRAGDGTSQPVPLVVFLHGAGERGTDNDAQLAHVREYFLKDSFLMARPWLLLAPQCPKGKRWVETHWNSLSHQADSLSSVPMGLLLALVQQLPQVLSDAEWPEAIDTNRIYITGLSMGGYGAFDLAVRLPDKPAALAVVCGGMDTAQAGLLQGMCIRIYHGANDKVVPVERGRAAKRALGRAGVPAEYVELKGVGHDSWKHAYTAPGFFEWLFSCQRARGER